MTGEENGDAVFEGAQTTYIVNSVVVSGNVNGPIMQIGQVGGVVSVSPEGEDD